MALTPLPATPSTPLLPRVEAEAPSEYVGHNTINMPSLWNVLFGVVEIWDSVKALRNARAPGTHEMRFDASVRLVQSPFLLAQGGCALTLNAIKAGAIFKLFAVGVAAASGILLAAIALGFFICGLEILFTTPACVRTYNFAHSILKPKQKQAIDFEVLKSNNEAEAIEYVRKRIHKYQNKPELIRKHFSPERAAFFIQFLKDKSQLKPQSLKYHYIYINKYLEQIEKGVEASRLHKALTDLEQRYLAITPAQQALIDAAPTLSQQQELRTEMLKHNQNRLAGRILACGVNELTSKLPDLLPKLQPPPVPSIKKMTSRQIETIQRAQDTAQAQACLDAHTLLNQIEIQAKKKLRLHYADYATLGFATLGFALAILFPYVGVALGIIAGVISLGRWIYLQGSCNHLGWEFKKERCWQELRGSVRTVLQAPLQLFR